MSNQIPSVGRIVHYVDKASVHNAAIVVVPGIGIGEGAEDFEVSLWVSPGDVEKKPYRVRATRSDDNSPNSWHWPEYVPAKSG